MSDPARQEREAIVAWLRAQAEERLSFGNDEAGYWLDDAASAIQAGDHLTHQESKT